MRKILSFFVVCAILKIQAQAQSVVLSENFNTYNGRDSTVPPGWIFSTHGNYFSISFSGSSGPNSYQFGTDSAYIITPAFVMADSISFWIKGTSTISVLNRLVLLGTSGNSIWDTIAALDSLPKSGRIVSLPLNGNYIKLKFVFLKVAGNLALDDVVLKANLPTEIKESLKGRMLFLQGGFILRLSPFNENETSDLTLYNSSGQLVLQKKIHGEGSLDLSNMAKGLYIAEARIGEKRCFKKIIIYQ